MPTPEIRESKDGVIKHLHVEFDEKYLKSTLDEFNAGNGKSFTLAEVKKVLADRIVDEAYYDFQEWMENAGQ